MSSDHDSGQALIVTAPDDLRGQRFSLADAELSIGRAESNDVRLENPYVSRRHAVLRRAGRALVIHDLGSSGGLLVNGTRTGEPTLLHIGDRIRLGDVELELVGGDIQEDGQVSDRTVVRAPGLGVAERSAAHVDRSGIASSAGIPAAPPPPVFDVKTQRGQVLSNVAGDQYNNRVAGNQYNVDALRLDPMRRRARWVMRTGLVLIVLGVVGGLVGAAIWDQGILHCMSNVDTETSFSSCVHPAGFAVAGLGSAALLFGVIAVITSLFMRREVRKREAGR